MPLAYDGMGIFERVASVAPGNKASIPMWSIWKTKSQLYTSKSCCRFHKTSGCLKLILQNFSKALNSTATPQRPPCGQSSVVGRRCLPRWRLFEAATVARSPKPRGASPSLASRWITWRTKQTIDIEIIEDFKSHGFPMFLCCINDSCFISAYYHLGANPGSAGFLKAWSKGW